MSERVSIKTTQLTDDTEAIRAAVVADDAAGGPAIGSGADCSLCRKALLEIDFTGSANLDTWTLVPLIPTVAGTAYKKMMRDSIVVTARTNMAVQGVVIDAYGSSDLNVYCTSPTGTSPTLASIQITPLQ